MSTTPHDALFKAVFSRLDHAASILRAVLPPSIAARIDFSTLALCPGSFIDQQLAASHSDLLFSATISGRPILIHVLFEHQSKPELLMAFRLLRYMVRIWDLHLATHPEARLLPPILPVVLHHSDTGWRGAVAFEEILDVDQDTLAVIAYYVPSFRFILDDISFEDDDALRARAMTALGRLVLWWFRHARHPDELVERLGAWREVTREVRSAPNGRAALSLVWRYILTIANHERPEELVLQLIEAAGPEAEEEILSVADYLEERGRRKGHDEGLQEGRREGQQSTLIKLLGRRFGALPEAVVQRIKAADEQLLDGWIERVLTASSLEEALGQG